jgi:hypothetical protein
MSELRDRLVKAKYFTKLDLKDGFYLISMAEREEWKTAFRCQCGLYEYRIMPFGLCNAPSTFQSMIKGIFLGLLDKRVIAYLEYILRYLEDEESTIDLVRRIMECIRKAKLCVSINKSVIDQQKVVFLRYHISQNGISITSEKVKVVKSWPVPRNIKDVQGFLGFTNFY